MQLALTIDVEEEGLFNGRFPVDDPPLRNIAFLDRLDPIVSELDLRPTLLVSYHAARNARHRERILRLAGRWRAEIGAHLHPWNTPPLVNLPHRQPVPSELIPKDILSAKLATLWAALADMGVVPTSFRMGRFNLGPLLWSLLSGTTVSVDSSIAPMRRYYGGPDHLGAPTDPYYPDPADPTRPGRSDILEVPVTILPILPGAGALLRRMQSGRLLPRGWAEWTARNLASLPAQPAWTGLRRLKTACRLHRGRGGRTVTVLVHSSELMPGGYPGHPGNEHVDAFLQRLQAFLFWLRTDLQAEPSTLTDLARRTAARRAVPSRG
jgi:hypothetical protein